MNKQDVHDPSHTSSFSCQKIVCVSQSYGTFHTTHTGMHRHNLLTLTLSDMHTPTHTKTLSHTHNSVSHTHTHTTHTHYTGTKKRLFVKDKIYRISTNDRHHLYPSPGDDVKNVHFIKWSQVLLVTKIPLHAPFFTFTETSNNHDDLVKNTTKNTHQQ